MKTSLHARHLDLDPRLKSRIERKLQRLDRVADPASHATVELTAGASRVSDAAHVAEVTLVAGGATIRSVANGATPLAAVDAVVDKLERQVVRAKERVREGRRTAPAPRGSVPGAPAAAAAGRRPTKEGRAETETDEAEVLEITRLDMVPMFPEDAIDRLEELNQAFFVFVNAQTHRVNVVYRRAGGGHGLIDPVVTP